MLRTVPVCQKSALEHLLINQLLNRATYYTSALPIKHKCEANALGSCTKPKVAPFCSSNNQAISSTCYHTD